MIFNSQNISPTGSASQFTQQIKTATADQHILLESNDLLAALMKQNVSVEQYCCYLLLMKEINDSYNKFIFRNIDQVLPNLNHRSSSSMIEKDLKEINYVLPAGPGIERYTLPKYQVNIPYSLGFMYVMEGSRLGGKVIYKHIQRVLGFTEERGAGYIADSGFNTGLLWKEFMTIFSEYVAANNFQEKAISGANDAFSSIYKYFELHSHLYTN